MLENTIKIFVPAILSFFIGIAITPFLSDYFYKKRMWKNRSRSEENTDAMSEAFKSIHNNKGEMSTPRIGGVLIWLSVLIAILLEALVSFLFPGSITDKLDFLSQNQTLLPLFAL